MEKFRINNNEVKKEDPKNVKFWDFKKKAKSTIVATGVALSALIPSKAEAQTSRNHEVIIVNNPDDPRLKEYNDSLYAYNQGQKNLEKARQSIEEYSKKLRAPIKLDEDKDLSVENYKANSELDMIGDVNLHDHIYGDTSDQYYDPETDSFLNIKYEDYILRKIKPETVLHVEARIAMGIHNWGVTHKDDFYPVYKKPVQEFKLDPSIKPIGKINIQGRDVKYYSEKQLNDILKKLKDNNIEAVKIGDSNDYTVSRFNEKTKGWLGDILSVLEE